MLINKKSIISFGLIICMLIPKYNLISIPGFHQGIRFDDLFLMGGLIYILLQRKIYLHVIPGGNIYVLFYGIILFYGILSVIKYGILPIILVLRWLEYSIFFMLLFYSSLNSQNIRKFIITYISINCIVVLLQHFEIIGGIFSFGYAKVVSSRVTGLTGGSWELPAVLSLFIVPLIYDNNLKYYKKLILIIISMLLVYLSNTRTGMIAFTIVSMFALFHVYKIRFTRLVLFVLMGTLFFFNTRPEYYLNIGNIPVAGSLKLRLDDWYEKFILMDYYEYIWGKGLGYSGLFMDGMYAKVFVDMGIIGILLFLFYYYNFLNSYKLIALVALIYSVTIDFFSGSKVMFAFYLSVYYLRLMRYNEFSVYRRPKSITSGKFIHGQPKSAY